LQDFTQLPDICRQVRLRAQGTGFWPKHALPRLLCAHGAQMP
jgi:hypothetical protein